jgi:predicted histidine transporter YuiF (NhaC family)
MIRRVILGTFIVSLVGVGTGAAFAGSPASSKDHELCVVLAKDDNHAHTQDYCVNWTGVQGR